MDKTFVFLCLNFPFPPSPVFQRLRKGGNVTNSAYTVGWQDGGKGRRAAGGDLQITAPVFTSRQPRESGSSPGHMPRSERPARMPRILAPAFPVTSSGPQPGCHSTRQGGQEVGPHCCHHTGQGHPTLQLPGPRLIPGLSLLPEGSGDHRVLSSHILRH